MNALKGLTSVHITAKTLLEATHAAVGQDIGCLQMGALAMVSKCIEFVTATHFQGLVKPLSILASKM
jgi:predicted RNase H-related nuclease YkuK (DUF458 family)